MPMTGAEPKSQMKRSGAALTVLSFILSSGASAADNARPPTVLPAIPASVAAISPTTTVVLNPQEIRAQLSPRRYTTLAAEIGAKIQRLPIAEGGAFKQGQL